jgi:leucyl aminopeptidase
MMMVLSYSSFNQGSGAVTVLETFRIMAQRNFKPLQTVEFHFYSAEEGGLLGSQDVSRAYKKAKVPVVGSLQIDMDGYSGDKKVIGLLTDYTDSTLTSFLRKLVQTYTSTKVVDTKCGYGCSKWKNIRLTQVITQAGKRQDIVLPQPLNLNFLE